MTSPSEEPSTLDEIVDLYQFVDHDGSPAENSTDCNWSNKTASPLVQLGGTQLNMPIQLEDQSNLKRVETNATIGPWSLESYLTPRINSCTLATQDRPVDGLSLHFGTRTTEYGVALPNTDSARPTESRNDYMDKSAGVAASSRHKVYSHDPGNSDLYPCIQSTDRQTCPSAPSTQDTTVIWPSISSNTTVAATTRSFTASTSDSTTASTRTADTHISDEAEVRTDLQKTLIKWKGQVHPVLIGPGGRIWEGPCTRVGCTCHAPGPHK